MAKEFDFSLGEDDSAGPRRAFRAKIPGLEVRLVKTGTSHVVADLSAMGLAFVDKSDKLEEGEMLTFDLLLNRKVFLSELKIRVMRILDNGIVGCNFEDNDHKKEARLDKLVLEVQKRQIALRKKAK